MLVTERKKNEFTAKDADQDLNRLLRSKDKSSVSTRPEFDRVHAVAALTVVIKYLEVGICYLSEFTKLSNDQMEPFDHSCHY